MSQTWCKGTQLIVSLQVYAGVGPLGGLAVSASILKRLAEGRWHYQSLMQDMHGDKNTFEPPDIMLSLSIVSVDWYHYYHNRKRPASHQDHWMKKFAVPVPFYPFWGLLSVNAIHEVDAPPTRHPLLNHQI